MLGSISIDAWLLDKDEKLTMFYKEWKNNRTCKGRTYWYKSDATYYANPLDGFP
ncbi:hypothetical protein [Methanococcoides sp. LMO-2]|uniref:Uncharacterized protein n=1 Tax=Methanococcoides cohabitans TaxID=3136559 RepID=A0ABU9KUH1_9EURY